MHQSRRIHKASVSKRLSIYLISYLLIISLLLGFISIHNDRASATRVVIEIHMDQAIATAKVGPGNSGVATATGKVVILRWPSSNVQRISVFLDVESNGWSATVSPPLITFNYGDRMAKPITLFVMAPQIALYNESRDVKITGTWKAFPAGSSGALSTGEVRPDDVLIKVEQYFYVFLDSPEPYKTAWPGTPVDYTLVIENRGNGLDSFHIEVMNAKALAAAGWAVRIERSSVDIPANGKKEVRITVYPPLKNTGWRNDVMEIPIKVTSKGSVMNETLETQTYSFYYRQFGLDLDPVPIGIIIIIIVVIIVVLKWAWDNAYI